MTDRNVEIAKMQIENMRFENVRLTYVAGGGGGGGSAGAMTTGQFSHPSEAELQAIMARAMHEQARVAARAPARQLEPMWRSDVWFWVQRGEKLVTRMAFWGEIPLIGDIIAWRLADRLDVITDALERIPT